jgi:predicted PurR-regulated permease PerM
MADSAGKRAAVELPWRTIFKVIAAVALVWLWLQLVEVVLVVIVAALLAVTLNPVVCWFERRGWSRAVGTALVAFLIVAIIAGFLWFTWAALSEQVRYLIDHFNEVEGELLGKVPPWARDLIGGQNTAEMQARIAAYTLRVGQSAFYALGVTVLGFILTLYFLIEARPTLDWLIAFTPTSKRARIDRTLVEGERVIFAYVAGNVLTSVIATVATLIALSALKVPAALLLALLAGISDFVPVVGFVLTAIPTILMGLTVSGTTALLVAAFYVTYNAVETYVISPWAYGDRMKMSNLAVLLAFIVGGQVAGVIGALIVLPIAALYPAIEEIWLRDKLGAETIEEHKAIEEAEGSR